MSDNNISLKQERRTFEEIDCIRCGFVITLHHPSLNLSDKEFDPLIQMWDSGTVGKIESPYGSTLDGNISYIGICDTCLKKSYEEGKAYYAGDYGIFDQMNLTEVEYDTHRRDKLKRSRRNNNINQLINNKDNNEESNK